MWTICGVDIRERWDIFCRVIDNYGDIGVCWRLAADLAARGAAVRLWVDDPAALAWMAPGALAGRWPRVRVLDWRLSHDPATLAALAPAGAWIEAFGCDIPTAFVQHRFGRRAPDTPAPAWINLEYLSAEGFARRAHGLPSPVSQGPARGHTKYFYYPGFTPASGGLLRESDLAERQRAFDRAAWLARTGIAWRGERLVSLFCYEPPALAPWLQQMRDAGPPTRLLVSAGRAAAAVRAAAAAAGTAAGAGHLSVDFLPLLAQTDFDHLLWSCELNFVRGEDSLVRALWAGKPFVWQIYPQHDDAHHAKLRAFLDAVRAPAHWRLAHGVWNGLAPGPMPGPDLQSWADAAQQARQGLLAQSDLATRLQAFAAAVLARQAKAGEKR